MYVARQHLETDRNQVHLAGAPCRKQTEIWRPMAAIFVFWRLHKINKMSAFLGCSLRLISDRFFFHHSTFFCVRPWKGHCIAVMWLWAQHVRFGIFILGPGLSFHCYPYSLSQTTVCFRGHHWEVEYGHALLWVATPDASKGWGFWKKKS